MYKMTASEKKDHDRYEVEEDLRTLSRAREIKKDKTRLKKAMTMAREQMKEMQGIAEDGSTHKPMKRKKETY